MKYLAHHGIKGQKWGEQNGPPYPLNTQTHNRVVNGSANKTSSKKEQNNKYDHYMQSRVVNINPDNHRNNCRELAFVAADNLTKDHHNVAGPKESNGNLYDYATTQAGFSLSRMDTDYREINGNRDNAKNNATKYISKKYKEGDIGLIGVTYDESYILPGSVENAHAFNWMIQNNEVVFFNLQDNFIDTKSPDTFFSAKDEHIPMECLFYGNINDPRLRHSVFYKIYNSHIF